MPPLEPTMNRSTEEPACSKPGCCGGVDRRDFIKLGGVGIVAAGLRGERQTIAGPFEAPFKETDAADHYVPADKKLSHAWVKQLFAKGERTWRSGDELKTIGMPVGGVAAGQLYLTGDGRLVYWGIFNQFQDTGFGESYQEGREPTKMMVRPLGFIPAPDVDQGFALQVKANDQIHVRTLDGQGFPGVRFCGEYPIAQVEYRAKEFPLEVDLEAFSPFIPLNADDSSLPATILSYTLKNTSDERMEVTLAGWLENAALHYGREQFTSEARRANRVSRGPGVTQLEGGLVQLEKSARPERPPIVLADFEGDDYGEWQIEGEAFGDGPARGSLDGQQPVTDFEGKRLANSFLGGDQAKGKLVSPSFKIERPLLSFLIGGGAQAGKTCINLIVAGEIVRTAIGKDSERLEAHNWPVQEFEGSEAHLEIIDAANGPWGHINVDQIALRESPLGDHVAELHRQPDFGTMGLALIGAASLALSDWPLNLPLKELFNAQSNDRAVERDLSEKLRGAVGATFALEPGEVRTVTFVVSWCMPNLYEQGKRVGNHYATRFSSAAAVASYVGANLPRLIDQTRLWRDTYYDSTLPYWLLDRCHATVANLATATCQWWENGRFWAYEGCGCCRGTCGHVWNYEHAMARLFPSLERSVREMQDFAPGVGFIPETGEIRFRGEDWGIWAGDSQGGYIMKAYREHQIAPDDAFLKRNWPQIKKAVEFLIGQDGDSDGLIEGRQHQTYDQDYFGANTMVGALYLGALRAAEEMARELGDDPFAGRCRQIFEAGQKNSMERLFNGEYFIQDVDLQKHPHSQYGDGCLADQMFGQGWAHQVALGYLYPQQSVRASLQSIWKYNWAPNVAAQNEHHPPQRWFAYPGEAGLFICTWPKSEHLGPNSTLYRDEVWSGIEYQVASHMACEGMLTEALAICRAVHERYDPLKRNPFNEVECGDHYARALASWGVLIGLAGFEYHGPQRRLGFHPRITPEKFRGVFTASAGWGILDQTRGDQTHGSSKQEITCEVKWGSLDVKTFTCDLAPGRRASRVSVDGEVLDNFQQKAQRLTMEFSKVRQVSAGEELRIDIDT